MFEIESVSVKSKKELYEYLSTQVENLLAEERDRIANCANFCSLLFYTLPDINWMGFYFLRDKQLLVGPFQGKPACVRIAMGQGVCGMVAAKRETLIVPNVHEFSGHIACDTASNSEMVLPVVEDQRLIAVLDIDSPVYNRFDTQDQKGMERLLTLLMSRTDM
jgi:L-methionine (R)-S-oxide reductase